MGKLEKHFMAAQNSQIVEKQKMLGVLLESFLVQLALQEVGA
tara:strand:+ start:717 stop:842 length:126 start_codon:yes stop_codon:yes gene_type:complete